jgi:threonine dehydratase
VIPPEWLEQAKLRIDAHIRKTPLGFDAQRQLFIKWENHQTTGSFKMRGAFNKILSLGSRELEQGLVCASAGNHGQAVSLAAQLSGTQVIVFVGENAAAMKVERMRALGADIHVVKGGYGEAEAAGRKYAAEKHMNWISPYNDGQVIAGQGTIALEILEQIKGIQPAVWLVPVGGGGLIAGVGAALSQLNPRPRLIGVQPVDNAFMYRLLSSGIYTGWEDLPSLADGLTGTVEDSSVTIPIARQVVDEIVLVREEEIANAIAFAWFVYHEVIEGSGAVSLAALLNGKVTQKPAVAIVSGGNIDLKLHTEIVSRYAGETWD